jgi:hypothetical protein
LTNKIINKNNKILKWFLVFNNIFTKYYFFDIGKEARNIFKNIKNKLKEIINKLFN